MKKQLTQEQIQFIGNYLKNSGVEYIDTRAEVVDHVASEIEIRLEDKSSTFYEEFKAYMVQHKKTLLKNIGKYRWALDKRILKQVFVNLIQRKVLVFFILLLSAGIVFMNIFFFEVEDLKYTYGLISLGVLLVSVVYPLLWFRKQKISVINRAAVLCYFANCIFFDFVLKLVDDYILVFAGFLTIMIWFNISFAYTQIKYFKTFKDKFQLS